VVYLPQLTTPDPRSITTAQLILHNGSGISLIPDPSERST